MRRDRASQSDSGSCVPDLSSRAGCGETSARDAGGAFLHITLVAPTDRQRRLSPGTWQWEGEAGAGTQTSPLCPSHFRAPEQSQRSRRREAFQRTQRGVRLILIAEDTIHFRHRSQKLLSWIWTERFLPEEGVPGGMPKREAERKINSKCLTLCSVTPRAC